MTKRALTITHDQLSDPAYKLGERGFDLAKDLASKAKGIACGVYRNFPGVVVPYSGVSALNGFWDSFCEDDAGGLPPIPPQPPNPGKCQGISYNLFIYYYREEFGVCQDYERTESMTLYGKITVGGIETNPGNGYTGVRVEGKHGDGSPASFLMGTNATDACGWRVEVIRADGLPDNCEPLPRKYPPPQDFVPPSGDVDIAPRRDLPDFKIPLPFVFIAPDFELNFLPKINIGGIDIDFNLGGIHLEFNPPSGFPSFPSLPGFPDFILPELPSLDIDFPDFSPQFGDLSIEIDNSKNEIITNNNSSRDEIINNNNNNTNNLNADLNLNLDANFNNFNNIFAPRFDGIDLNFDGIKEDLDEIKDKQPPPLPEPSKILLTYPRGTCLNGEWTPGTGEMETLLDDAEEWLTVLTQVDKGREENCGSGGDCVPPIPDWWAVRLGSERPQLVFVFRGKTNKSYNSLCLPHPFDTSPPTDPPLPSYRSGNVLGRIILKDNSRFDINAETEAEANRFIDLALFLIDPDKLSVPLRAFTSTRQGQGIIVQDRELVSVAYFPTGQKQLIPAWLKSFSPRIRSFGI